MKLKLLPCLTTVSAQYTAVDHCPLCGSDGIPQGRLARDAYRFGLLRIPLPPQGVTLRNCMQCDLLWKDQIPTAESVSTVMQHAQEEWKTHRPALEAIQPYLVDDLLDIGAAQGVLLDALRERCTRVSAFDIVRYEACQPTGEYIFGQFEDDLRWSGVPYSVVTAFDVFEHFRDASLACRNILQFVRPGGHLIIETGDWHAVSNLHDWYYANLFEHQIFWSDFAIRYLAQRAGLAVVKYERVNHKARRDYSALKRMALRLFRGLPLTDPLLGIDARLVPPPHLEDHLFAVLRKPVVEAVAA